MGYNVGFVGTGASPDDPGQDGFAMAYKHAGGYSRLDDCRLTACADIVPENAERFAEEFDIDTAHVFEDYEAMLRTVDLDIVSVCVPPDLHADIVAGCAEHGDLEAIHCEKPMATTWTDCQEMCRVCEYNGVKLTFNHQKRTGPVYKRAKELLDSGRIGELRRVEWSAQNLFDSGTHMFDLSALYTDQSGVEWVSAALDYRDENRWFGVHNENQAVAEWKYENGVYGHAMTGRSSDALGAQLRLVGADGTIEIGVEDGPPLRVRTGRTLGWKTIDVGENVWGNRVPSTYTGYVRWGGEMVAERMVTLLGIPVERFDYPSHIDRAIESVVTAVREDGESPLSWRNAIESTEVVFAAWESARRGARVDLHLEIDDNPLEAMVQAGELPVSEKLDGVESDEDGQSPDSTRQPGETEEVEEAEAPENTQAGVGDGR